MAEPRCNHRLNLGFGLMLVFFTIIAHGHDVRILDDNSIGQLSSSDTGDVRTLLFSVLDRLTTIDQSLSTTDQRLTALDQRLTSLDQRFTALDLRMTSLDQRVANVGDNVDTLLRRSSLSTNQNIKEEESTEPPPPQPFRLTRVSKTETEEAYSVTMNYEGDRKPLIYIRNNWKTSPELLPEQELGSVSFLLQKFDPVNHPFEPHVHFALPDTFHSFQLNIVGSAVVMDVPHVTLELTPGIDVTYPRGSFPEFDVEYKVDAEEEEIGHVDGHCLMNLKSSTEENTIVSSQSCDRHNHGSVWLTGEKEAQLSKMYSRGTVGMNSTLTNPEGVISAYITVNFNCSDKCLVASHTLYPFVRFHREDHSGPLPEDFLGFVMDKYRNLTYDFFCDKNSGVGSQCLLYCSVMSGSEPVKATIVRELPGSDLTEMNSVELPFPALHESTAMMGLDNVSEKDAGNYLCVATTPTRSLRRTITLVVVESPAIDRELSNVTKVKDSQGQVQSAVITCVARGSPTPDVTITIFGLDPEDYSINISHPDNDTTQAEMLIPDYSVIAENLVTFGQCHASNVGNPHYNYIMGQSWVIRFDQE